MRVCTQNGTASSELYLQAICNSMQRVLTPKKSNYLNVEQCLVRALTIWRWDTTNLSPGPTIKLATTARGLWLWYTATVEGLELEIQFDLISLLAKQSEKSNKYNINMSYIHTGWPKKNALVFVRPFLEQERVNFCHQGDLGNSQAIIACHLNLNWMKIWEKKSQFQLTTIPLT